ncbi:uncharacterized protein KNAG_0J00690 [Huiozyma naganishii CBS 8797]|uniref:BTB domain-containing protein n=1 Tax=Huiozyma naganishii (strain ATCC MYA-139 / BCRC 22969 / CBS 8797 / KCTC 17520 / NBRC 10181 / NCYC 3082 / Yp74L-3) TaxID=1071383 RepID=J7S2N8_HUIN7|nr:hypothetical protein KNAG_0J00690 [Kazachstania naganishii CBS 8797]CCK72152.1 hypothetical protein KNAG_0J00690 [Kazachstania naganishii CBS 8797]
MDVYKRDWSCLVSVVGGPGLPDPHAQECESGYTPLHLLLDRGHLHIAERVYSRWAQEWAETPGGRRGHISNARDREGLTPLELYRCKWLSAARHPRGLSYKWGPRRRIQIEWTTVDSTPTDASHVLTLGSNTNYQLGTGHKDDRQNFYQLHVDQLPAERGPAPGAFPSLDKRIVAAKVTKYYSTLVLNDGTLYTAGNSSRGRLASRGNNSNGSPQLGFTRVAKMPSLVLQLASSEHHTVVLCEDGAVLSWGWNSFAQLGHSSTANYDENACCAVPRRIRFPGFPTTSGPRITSVSCSRIHSAAISQDGQCYLWGLNVGQMGTSASSAEHAHTDTHYAGHPGHIEQRPVVVQLPAGVQQVLCTEFATFVRAKGNTLHVLSNYTTRTFKVPLPRGKGYRAPDPFNHFTRRDVPNGIVDMKCSNKFGNNIAFRFECGRLGTISIREESRSMWSNITNNVLPVNLTWSPNYKFDNCRDFDIATSGRIVLCTAAGQVYKATGDSQQGFEMIHSGKLVSGHALRVSCDSTFGSFLVLKDETTHIAANYGRDNLINEFATHSPWGSTDEGVDSLIFGMRGQDTDSTRSLITLQASGSNQFEEYSVPQSGPSRRQSDGNVVFLYGEGPLCRCDRTLLKSKCQRFVKSLQTTGQFMTEDGNITFTLQDSFESDRWNIAVAAPANFPVGDALAHFVHFLYTDGKPTKQQFTSLIFNLAEDALHFRKLNSYLQELLQLCLNYSPSQETLLEKPDTIVQLNDGIVYAHSFILATRMAFFKTWNKREWARRDADNMKVIAIPAMSIEHFVCFLKYAYASGYKESVSDVPHGKSFFECLQFLLELLQFSDRFLMIPYMTFLEALIATYITGDTVLLILINAHYCNAHMLSMLCCSFICMHVGILFTADNMPILRDSFTPQLWHLLEGTLRDSREPKLATHLHMPVPWYEDHSVNWLSLFKNNIKAFNDKFISQDRPFEPLFDLKVVDLKPKSTSRRGSIAIDKTRRQSSSVGRLKGNSASARRKSSFANQVPVEILRRNSVRPSVDTSAIEDTDEFIEVKKKSKRRDSEQSKPIGPVTKQTPTSRASISEIVIHSEDQSTTDLPSLLTPPSSSKADVSTSGSTEDVSSSKGPRVFKKTSQKERRKNSAVDGGSNDKSGKKPVWGTSTVPKSKTKDEKSNNSGSKSTPLPSLLNGVTPDIKQQRKRGKKKPLADEGSSVKITEFVSSGNPGGIKPYMTSTKSEINEIAATFSDPTAEHRTSVEEQIAALEFEKWFAKESAKVQINLKKDANNLQAVYASTDNFPEFFGGQEGKPKKKVKAKFPSKRKVAKSDVKDVIR